MNHAGKLSFLYKQCKNDKTNMFIGFLERIRVQLDH